MKDISIYRKNYDSFKDILNFVEKYIILQEFSGEMFTKSCVYFDHARYNLPDAVHIQDNRSTISLIWQNLDIGTTVIYKFFGSYNFLKICSVLLPFQCEYENRIFLLEYDSISKKLSSNLLNIIEKYCREHHAYL